MAGNVPAVLVHRWLGELRRYGENELIGSVDIDPGIRAPRRNGARDIEVLLHAPAAMTGAALREHADCCAERIGAALARLEAIKQFAVQHAPPGWVQQYAPASGTPAGVLFLDGVETGAPDGTLLVFDYGDLDQLVTRVDDQGNGVEVYLRA